MYVFMYTVYTRVQVEFFGRENGLKKLTSTYIRENMRHTYRITKKCQNSLQQAKLRSLVNNSDDKSPMYKVDYYYYYYYNVDLFWIKLYY